MTTPIGPGDWVECIDDGSGDGYGTPLRVGAIYRVNGIIPDWQGKLGLTLDGVEPPTTGSVGIILIGFAPELFRPIYRPKADFIESLKAPAHHQREREPV